MRRYFHEEAHFPVEVVLFQSYETQVLALLTQPGEAVPRIDIAWNTNLAYLQADEWSGHACRAIAMRDTDLGWMTKIVAVNGGPISTLADLKNRTLALGSRDSGHAAILPVHFLEQQGMREGMDYRTLIGEILSGAIRRYKEREQRRAADRDVPAVSNGNGNGNGALPLAGELAGDARDAKG